MFPYIGISVSSYRDVSTFYLTSSNLISIVGFLVLYIPYFFLTFQNARP